jgi:hypothetical protein
MKGEQTSSLSDRFLIGTLTESTDSRGRLSKTYVNGDPQAGSLVNPTTRHAWLEDKSLAQYDALFRTAQDVVALVGDRVMLIEKNAVPVDPAIYYVVAPATVYRSVVVYPLNRVCP